jgi:hypothetical protein
MSLPWDLDNDWMEKAEKRRIQPGTARYIHYHSSLVNKNHYNIRIPTIAGLAILGVFVLIVMIAAARNALPWVRPTIRHQKLFRWLRTHWTQAPSLRHRHARLYLVDTFFSLQLPLRSQSVILCALALSNLIPLIALHHAHDPFVEQQ